MEANSHDGDDNEDGENDDGNEENDDENSENIMLYCICQKEEQG